MSWNCAIAEGAAAVRDKRWLIVNADDYGRFKCTSRGILEAAQGGMVTATGIMGNMPDLREQLTWLDVAPGLDLGAHLTLSAGPTLSCAMQRKFGGSFPNKFKVLVAVLSGVVRPSDVLEEWTAQIERLFSLGAKLTFLNSHEHLHMYPALFDVSLELAQRHNLANVRFVQPRPGAVGRFPRDIALRFMARRSLRKVDARVPEFLGLEESGRIDVGWLGRLLSSLERGRVYELMCHPGRYDEAEIESPALKRYHDWEGELCALTDRSVLAMCKQLDVVLIGFRDVPSVIGEVGLV